MRNITRNCIFLAVCLTSLQSLHGQQGWGHLKGKIIVEGDVPKAKALDLSQNAEGCFTDGKKPVSEDIIVGKNGEFKDVFVMMYLKGDKPAVHPSYEEQKNNSIVLDNKNCVFSPHTLFIRTGQKLELKNSDEVGHNCHSKLFNNEFNVTVPKGDSIEMNMSESERVPGSIVCDIHPWMNAVALVRDEPYVAITDKNGEFEIKNIPAGKWKFQFWHKKMNYMRKLEVPEKKVGRRGEIEVEIEDGEVLDLGEMKVNASAFKK